MRWTRAGGVAVLLAVLLYGSVLVFQAFDRNSHSNSDRYANRDSNRDPLFDTRGANKSFRDCNLMQPDQTLVDGQCK